MELRRVANASTYIMFPVVDDTGKAFKTTRYTTKARYLAWGDTSEPFKWSLQNCAYAATYVGGPDAGIAQLQVAHTELPIASPYVIFVIEGTPPVATQYILVNTATQFATLATITHTGATVPSVTTVTGNVAGNVTGSVGSVTGAVGSVTGAVGSVTGNVGGNVTGSVGSIASGGIDNAAFAAGAIDAAAIAANAIGDAELAADGASKYADAFLYRNLSGGAAGGRDVRSALYVLRNKVDINSGVMTVYNTDDTGSAWTATVATGGTSAIITVDPG